MLAKTGDIYLPNFASLVLIAYLILVSNFNHTWQTETLF